MRVDFYQLSESPVEAALPALAAKMREAGAKVLVVSADEDQRARISDALWAPKGSFLAHGAAGGAGDARQPILLSGSLEPVNGATFLVLADGLWRPSQGFERIFLVFNGQTVEAARGAWRELDAIEGCERHFWQQQDGRWSEN